MIADEHHRQSEREIRRDDDLQVEFTLIEAGDSINDGPLTGDHLLARRCPFETSRS
jgi:hypothetical protein